MHGTSDDPRRPCSIPAQQTTIAGADYSYKWLLYAWRPLHILADCPGCPDAPRRQTQRQFRKSIRKQHFGIVRLLCALHCYKVKIYGREDLLADLLDLFPPILCLVRTAGSNGDTLVKLPRPDFVPYNVHNGQRSGGYRPLPRTTGSGSGAGNCFHFPAAVSPCRAESVRLKLFGPHKDAEARLRRTRPLF